MQKIKIRDKTKAFLNEKWMYIFPIIYIVMVLIYSVFFMLSDGENVLLASNELGDFLAGVFSPIAFLFLILGYLQQKKVITDNTKVLTEQMEELRLSKQLMLESNQPLFNFVEFSQQKSDESHVVDISCRIKNENQNCKLNKLYFLEERDNIQTYIEYGYLMRGESLEFKIKIFGLAIIEPALLFKVLYIDIFGNEKEILYILEYSQKNTKIKKCPTKIEMQFHADEY